MAKAKEKMEALVPVEEQPYTVPANWRWVYLDSVITLISGRDASLKECNDNGIGIPYILGASNISDNGFIAERWIEEPQVISQKGDILISVKGTIGKLYLQQEESINLSRQIMAIRPVNELNTLYCFFFLLQICDQLRIAGNGLIPGISRSDILNTKIAIPPYTEQVRIVNSLKNFFTKLDEAKEKAQAVVDGYEDRKAAILHKAFIGDLTEKWRKENKVSNQWRTVCFDEVADIRSNLVDPSEYQGYPHIAPDNIEKKTGRLLEYRTVAEDKVKSGKHLFHSGQILYSKIRPYLSKVIIVDFDGLCSADMYPIDAKENMLLRFLWYYMLSDDFLLQASSAGSRSVLPKINQKELSGLLVRTTIEKEQIEVVRILDTLLQSIQNTKDIAERTIESIDEMKKSILAKAFRGELGTNDPSEEPVAL